MVSRNFGRIWKCFETLCRVSVALRVKLGFPVSAFPCCLAALVIAMAPPQTVDSVKGQTHIRTAQPDLDFRQERWSVIHTSEGRVGHSVYRSLGYPATDLIATQLSESEQTWLRVNRGSESITQHFELSTKTFQPKGRIRSDRLTKIQSKLGAGGELDCIEGVREGDILNVTATVGEASRVFQLAIPADCQGFFALQRSLHGAPLKPGERREFESVVPLVTKVATTKLVAQQWEETALLEGTKQLLRIDGVVELAETPVKFVLWVDELGQIQKKFLPDVGQTTYACTKAEVLSSCDTVGVDISAAAHILADNFKSRDPHLAKEALYYFRTVSNESVQGLIPNGRCQRVDLWRGQSLVVHLRPAGFDESSQSRDDVHAGGIQEVSSPDDLSANTIIDCDDTAIIALSQRLATDTEDPWETALAMERLVHEKVTKKNYQRTLDRASVVAKSGAGDCTEHAVLLAALCRARGIPSRFVTGLVYVGQRKEFGMHAWTEVFVDGDWRALDATIGQGGIGAGHIKIASSNLAQDSAIELAMRVSAVIGKVKTIECLGMKSAE